MERSNQRDSSLELVRLLSQYMIVVYHIILFWFWNYSKNPDILLRAIYIPLHIGVPVFVLLSGYFHIHFSLKGIARLVIFILVYDVGLRILGGAIFPEYLAEWHNMTGSSGSGLKQVFFVSGTGYWFVRTYLMLFLLSPMVNTYLDKISGRNRVVLILVLVWICCYIPMFHLDASLDDGKNIPTFIFWYVIGDTLSRYRDVWMSWKKSYLIAIYVFSQTLIALFYYVIYQQGMIGVSEYYYRYVFYYFSPILLISSVLFVMLFAGKPFYNATINKLSRSSLAIYLIHGSFIVFYMVIRHASIWIQENVTNEFGVIGMVLVLGLLVTGGCIIIDQILMPLINLLTKWLTNLFEKCVGNLTKEYKV